MIRAMLTTTDNPYNPFDDWDSWYEYDTRKGYNSSSLLARICVTSFELSEADEILSITQAIDEIVAENVSGMHMKVTKECPPSYTEEDIFE